MPSPHSNEIAMDTSTQSRIYQLATVALVCLLLFLVTAFVSQILRPDLSPIGNFLSAYALDDYGFVMTIGFVAFGIGGLSLTIALWRCQIVRRMMQVGVYSLGIGSVSMMFVALFPAEIDVPEPTIIGQLHDLFALIYFAGMTVGALLVSLSFRDHSLWMRHARSELALAIFAVVAFLIFFTSYPLQAGSEPTVHLLRITIGLTQRISIFAIWLWLLVTALRLQRLTAH